MTEQTLLEPLPHIADPARGLVSYNSYFVCKDVIMVWQVKRHHANHYVTNASSHNYFGSLDICYYYDYDFDVAMVEIAVRYCYQVHALLMNAGKTICIPRLVNESQLSMIYYI